MIQPTIGRRVWYVPSALDLGQLDKQPATTMTMILLEKTEEAPQALDAGVCFVWNEREVNLTVADHSGVMHARQNVQLVQEGDDLPEEGGYATWMPYQTTQAKAAA